MPSSSFQTPFPTYQPFALFSTNLINKGDVKCLSYTWQFIFTERFFISKQIHTTLSKQFGLDLGTCYNCYWLCPIKQGF